MTEFLHTGCKRHQEVKIDVEARKPDKNRLPPTILPLTYLFMLARLFAAQCFLNFLQLLSGEDAKLVETFFWILVFVCGDVESGLSVPSFSDVSSC